MARRPESFWNPNNLSASLGFTQLRYNRGYIAEPKGRAEGTHGTHYSNEKGFLYVYATTYNNGRDALGRYTQWTSDQRWTNERSAKRYQQFVVENMAGRIRRPRVSTGRLVQVTGNTAKGSNIDWGTDWWGVGNPTYLNKSQARYWRTIEEGSARVWKRSFIGDPLVGLWGETIGPFRGGYTGGRVTRAGANRQGKFLPYKLEKRLDIVASGAKIARVQQEIRPMNAYRDAWKQMGGAREMAYDMMSRLPNVQGRNSPIRPRGRS